MLLVVDSLDGGGAERYVADLARALGGRGHAVRVACSVGGELAEPLRRAGVEVLPLRAALVKRRVSVRFAAGLRRIVRERRPDVVHAHIYASAAASALATVGTGVPLVVTEHTEAPWRGRRAIWTSRWIYRRAASIHGVSRAIGRLLVDAYGVAPERFEHVPTAVTDVAAAPAAALPARCRGRRLVGHVGRLAPEKGLAVFIGAASLVAPRVPDAHFLVIGDGPLRPGLEALARRIGLAARSDFLGHRRDARALIAQLDLLVVASLSDGSPLVVLEARQAGVPVVASAVGGLPDQIRHDEDGVLVPPGDEGALASAITELLQDPARSRALGASGRERLETWTHERLVERVEATYRRLVARVG